MAFASTMWTDEDLVLQELEMESSHLASLPLELESRMEPRSLGALPLELLHRLLSHCSIPDVLSIAEALSRPELTEVPKSMKMMNTQ